MGLHKYVAFLQTCNGQLDLKLRKAVRAQQRERGDKLIKAFILCQPEIKDAKSGDARTARGHFVGTRCPVACPRSQLELPPPYLETSLYANVSHALAESSYDDVDEEEVEEVCEMSEEELLKMLDGQEPALQVCCAGLMHATSSCNAHKLMTCRCAVGYSTRHNPNKPHSSF